MAEVELINVNKDYNNDNYKNPLFMAANAINNPLSSKKESKGMADGSEEYLGGNSNQQGFAIKNLNLTIPDNKVTVLLGPSGSGKSTILKMIAGLEDFDSGEIRYNGENMADVAPRDRKIGIVFENFALYPHKSSKSNILARLIFNKQDKDEHIVEERLEKTSQLLGVDIEYLLDKKPAHLSEGEKQRVALGRCITRDPKLFLLDEPFASLDAKLRDKYRVEVKRLLNKFDITTIYVTHNQKEAIALGDEIVVIKDGKIEQQGSYKKLYNQPKNIFVAEFLNSDTESKAINLIASDKLAGDWPEGIIAVRPEDVLLTEGNDSKTLIAKVLNVELRPTRNAKIIQLKYKQELIDVKVDIEREIEIDTKVSFKFSKYHLFDLKTEQKIKTKQLD